MKRYLQKTEDYSNDLDRQMPNASVKWQMLRTRIEIGDWKLRPCMFVPCDDKGIPIKGLKPEDPSLTIEQKDSILFEGFSLIDSDSHTHHFVMKGDLIISFGVRNAIFQTVNDLVEKNWAREKIVMSESLTKLLEYNSTKARLQ